MECSAPTHYESEAHILACSLSLENKYFTSEKKKKQPGLWTFPSTQGLSGSHSQSVSCSVGNMSSCLLLAFLFSVSLASPHLHCLHSSVSWTLNCARLLIVATPVLKAAVKPTKVKLNGNNVRDIYCTCDKYGHTNKQTNRHGKCKATLGPVGHAWGS